jgi:hypothetical protein
MIVDDKNKIFQLKCDYCGCAFSRIKYDVLKSRKIIEKDSCGSKKCASDKRKESNLKKYGVANVYQNEHIRKKQQDTLFKNHGVLVPAKSKAILEKMSGTNLKKYGNTCSLHGKDVADKTKKTWLMKYGCDHPFASEAVREKSKSTMEMRYGSYFTKTEEYKKKSKETYLKKYGTEHSSMSNFVKEKRRKTNLKKYGHEYPSQNDKVMEKILASKEGKQTKYGRTQSDVREFLQDISGKEFKSKHIGRLELDIFNEDLSVAVEYCGLYWHNETSPSPRDSKYHEKKYKICKSLGIRLITIFEDEWIYRNFQCKNYLNSFIGTFSNKFHARKCKIIEISKKESNKFYEDYHIQGKPYGTKISFGIFYEKELLGCVSLGNHHRIKDKIILNRLCFKNGIRINGGASRLFVECKNWCLKNEIRKITTWSDNRWSEGNVYYKNGFALDTQLAPDYSYVCLKKRAMRISKQSMKKSNTLCPKGTTEKEWAVKNGFVRIWDCGKKRWTMIF